MAMILCPVNTDETQSQLLQCSVSCWSGHAGLCWRICWLSSWNWQWGHVRNHWDRPLTIYILSFGRLSYILFTLCNCCCAHRLMEDRDWHLPLKESSCGLPYNVTGSHGNFRNEKTSGQRVNKYRRLIQLNMGKGEKIKKKRKKKKKKKKKEWIIVDLPL